MCAAVGAGAFADLPAAGDAMVRLASTIEPDLTASSVYDDGYGRYRETYVALVPLFHAAENAAEE
jgi:sugar (pentulose or hexulose) kinase